MHIPRQARSLRNRILRQVTWRDKKYPPLLIPLRIAGALTERGRFLASYYAFHRYVDDVVDGDSPLPEGHQHAVSFVEERLKALDSGNSHGALDDLLFGALEMGRTLHPEGMASETRLILRSMLFDATRHGKTYSEHELASHYHQLDVQGTIRAALKAFGEHPAYYHCLDALGAASRIYYMLRDFDEDVAAGIYNVPQEALDQMGWDHSTLDTKTAAPWIARGAAQGMEHIRLHRMMIVDTDLRRTTRLTLDWLFERPAERYFQRILEAQPT